MIFDDEIINEYLDMMESDIDEDYDEINDIMHYVEATDIIASVYDDMLFESGDDYYVEGANYEVFRKFNELKKETDRYMKLYRMAMKEKDFKVARIQVDKIIDVGNKMVKEISDIEGDAFSIIVGNIIHAFQWYAKVILIAIGIGIPIGGIAAAIGIYTKAKLATSIGGALAAGGIGAVVISIKKKEKELTDYAQQMSQLAKSSDSGQANQAMNKFRNSIIAKAEAIVKQAEVLKKVVDVEEQKYNEKLKAEKDAHKQNVAESVYDLIDSYVDSVYESYENGEISEYERDMIIDEAADNLLAGSVIAEEGYDLDDEATREEAFYDIKKAVYERCANGEFDIATRENIIQQAYNQIFPAPLATLETGNNMAAIGTNPMTSNSNNTASNTAKQIDDAVKKASDDAKKQIEKNNDTNNIGQDLEKGMTNPKAGDPPMQESEESVGTEEQLDNELEALDSLID